MPPPIEFIACLLLGGVWPLLVLHVVQSRQAHLRLFILTLLAGCGAVPGRPVPKIPTIPTTAHETWRCVAPGAPAVVVEGTPDPARVEVAGVELDCYLVPLGR